jgi:S-adenosylmethionine decarboxylase
MGIHLIAEFMGVEREKIAWVRKMKPMVERAVKESGLKAFSSSYHQFRPHGVSCVYLLRESHLALHSWPEVNYLAVDIFSCESGEGARRALELLRKEFSPRRVKVRVVKGMEYEKLLRGEKGAGGAGGG